MKLLQRFKNFLGTNEVDKVEKYHRACEIINDIDRLIKTSSHSYQMILHCLDNATELKSCLEASGDLAENAIIYLNSGDYVIEYKSGEVNLLKM